VTIAVADAGGALLQGADVAVAALVLELIKVKSKDAK
jgi:hypothetical protein